MSWNPTKTNRNLTTTRKNSCHSNLNLYQRLTD